MTFFQVCIRGLFSGTNFDRDGVSRWSHEFWHLLDFEWRRCLRGGRATWRGDVGCVIRRIAGIRGSKQRDLYSWTLFCSQICACIAVRCLDGRWSLRKFHSPLYNCIMIMIPAPAQRLSKQIPVFVFGRLPAVVVLVDTLLFRSFSLRSLTTSLSPLSNSLVHLQTGHTARHYLFQPCWEPALSHRRCSALGVFQWLISAHSSSLQLQA
jgi:hypothetical protein